MEIILRKIDSALLLSNQIDTEEHNSRAEGLVTFPPNMISKCEREIVYHLLRLPVTPVYDPQILRIFDNGHAVHERLLKYLAFDGSLKEHELKVYDEENRIKGYIDAIITLDEDDLTIVGQYPGEPYVIAEFKSANSNECYWIEKNDMPSDKYVWQIQLYMHITGIHKGVILIERKDDQKIFEYWVNYDPQLVELLLDKVQRCLSYADQRILPDREGTRRGRPCWNGSRKSSMCKWYDICWSEDEGRRLIDAL
jgi:hypothetical protein